MVDALDVFVCSCAELVSEVVTGYLAALQSQQDQGWWTTCVYLSQIQVFSVLQFFFHYRFIHQLLIGSEPVTTKMKN